MSRHRKAQAITYSLLAGLTLTVAQRARAADDDVQEVVVTGIRASVQAAQDIKRDAPSVVEAITSEDLGKFTDSNIADALQRVPGINIERTDGTFDAGYSVTIRGLGGQYATSTLNGRELLGIPQFGGQGGRQFDFSTVPPEILSGVTVYKTSTASLVEPGLAGQVNMQTLRPLDYHGTAGSDYFGSVTAAGGYSNHSNHANPRFGATLGTKLLDNTLGVYVAGLYANDWTSQDIAHAYDGQQSFSLTNGATYDNALTTAYGYDLWRAHKEQTKRSGAAGVQWRGSNLEVNLDYLYNQSGIRRRDQADYWYPSIGSGGFGDVPIPPSAVTLAGTGPGLAAWDATQIPGLTGYSYNYLGYLKLDYINTSQNAGANIVWKSDDGKRKASFDYSDSGTNYTISWLHPYLDNSGSGTDRETVNAAGSFPILSETNVGTGPSFTDPAAYNTLTFYENFQKRNRGNRQAVRVDFEAELTDALKVKTGVRYVDTDSKFVSMDLNAQHLPTSAVGGLVPGALEQLPFLTYETPVVSLAGFCAANPQFCSPNNFGKGSLVGPFPTSADGKPGDVLAFDPSQSYEMRETNLAPYLEFDFKGSLFGINSSGNLGVRGVRLLEQGLAFQGGCTKQGFDSGPCLAGTVRDTLVSDENMFWSVLPSANITLMPREDLNVRAAVGKSITLPDYNQLAPLGSADILLPTAAGTTVGRNVAITGNINLRPTSAWNFDLTGEYYTPYGGAIITSLFYKKVKDLIVTTTEFGVPIPGQGNLLFDSTQAVNASSGHTDGVEINTNQPFTFLPAPWDGFGIQANYTYVQSVTVVSGAPTQFPGSSKNNFNVTTYFEKNGFSARVAVSYRGPYLTALGTPGDGGAGDQINRAQTRIDASISQAFGKHFEVILTGSNLTSQAVKAYSPVAGSVANYFSLPAVYELGVRASF